MKGLDKELLERKDTLDPKVLVLLADDKTIGPKLPKIAEPL